ncbi:MAG: aspartate kinase [Bacteroidales bacterium]
MKVFKFGGASVKDADAVRNVAAILRKYENEKLVVVISAIGKTTNMLEKVLVSWFDKSNLKNNLLQEVINYHLRIIEDLFQDSKSPVYTEIKKMFQDLETYIFQPPRFSYDQEYDQVVCYGELLSTTIIHYFLRHEGIASYYLDVRKLILTDSNYREGRINWDETTKQIQNGLNPLLEMPGGKVILTQGFLGSDAEGFTTTLGREGSDFTAAIFAFALETEEMIIWKDVPGLLNADPKYFSKTEKLAQISYREAIELSYYGATIIHPKTIKPLQNKNIPLRIKSFVDPDSKGSLIHLNTASDSLIPSFIFKVEQVLISISPRDFSFIDEQNLSEILGVFAHLSVRINLMQNSAISFSVCVDNNERRLKQLFKELSSKYEVRYNTGLELITIRHYDQATINRILEDKKTILLEMRTRTTAQLVVRPLASKAE